ncbi:Hamartin, partial [Orchesella cincta]
RKMASSLGSSGGGSSSGGPGGNHGQPQALTDVTQIFDLLESNKPDVVQEVKDLILENLNSTKESWLVSGLYEYYIQSGMTDGIKSPLKETRRQALDMLYANNPLVVQNNSTTLFFRELIKLLKTETDVVILLTGLLAMIMMLPIIPMFIVCNIQDIFDVFGRLATWTNTTHNIPREHLLHLQVGLYSLFHRLYAMFPCNFLSYLRHNFFLVLRITYQFSGSFCIQSGGALTS